MCPFHNSLLTSFSFVYYFDLSFISSLSRFILGDLLYLFYPSMVAVRWAGLQ